MTEAAVAETGIVDQEPALGAARRRKKPPKKPNLGVTPVETPSAKDAAKETKLLGHLHDSKGKSSKKKEAISNEKTFMLDYTDTRGYHWGGSFTSKILTIRQRTIVGLTRARLAGGIAPEHLDEGTLSLLEMQAHLAVCLSDAPDWAEDLAEFHDLGVLASIYKEVALHESTFWGADTEGDSEG